MTTASSSKVPSITTAHAPTIVKSLHLFPYSPSSSLSPSSPLPSPSPGHGPGSRLRSQISHLLPRHALFHVHLTIHQINAVPLLRGEFGVRWRFSHAREISEEKGGAGGAGGNGSGTTLLSRMKGKMKSGGGSSKVAEEGKGSEKERESEEDDEDGRETSSSPTTTDSNTISSSGDDANSLFAAHANRKTAAPPPPPLPPLPGMYLTPDWHPSSLHTPAFGHPIPTASTITPSSFRPITPLLSASVPSTSTSPLSPSPISPVSHARKGSTPFAPLKDHAASWEHSVAVVVRLGIDRETNVLLPNELQLDVVQVSAVCSSLSFMLRLTSCFF
jgi:hypothetical protein